jgi:hypothetical protein
MPLNIDKFSVRQLFNDSKGKTSPTLTAGFVACMVALGGFLAAGNLIIVMVIFKFEKDPNVINFLNMIVMQSIGLFTLGGTMLGVHRLSKDKQVNETEGAK